MHETLEEHRDANCHRSVGWTPASGQVLGPTKGARDTIAVWQGSEMTSCLGATRGHEAAKVQVFINHFGKWQLDVLKKQPGRQNLSCCTEETSHSVKGMEKPDLGYG